MSRVSQNVGGRGFFVVAALVLSGAFWLHGLSAGGKSRIADDAYQTMTMGYNLYHHGVLSDDDCLKEGPCERKPTAYRGPGYPAFLALGMWLHPQLQSLTLTELTESKNLNPFRHDALFLLYGITWFAFFLTLRLTRHSGWALGAALLVAFNPTLVNYQNEFITELLQAFFVTLLAMALVYAVDGQRRFAALSGVALGGLALTNPTFYYLGYPLLPILWWCLKQQGVASSKRNQVCGIFFAAFLLVVGSWMFRNKTHFGRMFLSERGGVILNIRAEKDSMRFDEFLASFVYWSNCECIRGKDDTFEGQASYQRLIRGNNDSFYRVGKARRSELNRQYSPAESDRLLEQEAKAKILAHPFRHLGVSLATLYRSIAVFPCGLDLLIFSAFIFNALYSVIRGRWLLFLALCPAAFGVFFSAFVGYGLPRYNIMNIPLLLISAVLVLQMLGQKFSGHRPSVDDPATRAAD